MEVLNKSQYGNSHLQMRQNPITIEERSWHRAMAALFEINIFNFLHYSVLHNVIEAVEQSFFCLH